MASPASPPHYMYNPVKTIKTNTVGTVNMLGLAKRVNARILIASTSEIYGDPEVNFFLVTVCKLDFKSDLQKHGQDPNT